MKILKILFAIGLAVVALTIFGKIRQNLARGSASSAGGSELSAAGFFLLKRDGAEDRNVTIVSPPNCPSDEAVRARALAESLRAAGIPCQVQPGIEATFTDPADAERVNRHMANVGAPLVVVRGWAKGNPSTADVIAQYRAPR